MQSTDRSALLNARAAWDLAVFAYRDYGTVWAGGSDDNYRLSLAALDSTWRAASLPLPWFPSSIARGAVEQRPTA